MILIIVAILVVTLIATGGGVGGYMYYQKRKEDEAATKLAAETRLAIALAEEQQKKEEEEAQRVETPVDGVWGAWVPEKCLFTPDTACRGTLKQNRTCSLPLNGGRGCVGPNSRTMYCESDTCLPKTTKFLGVSGNWTPGETSNAAARYVAYPGIDVAKVFTGANKLFKLKATTLPAMIEECNSNIAAANGKAMTAGNTGCSAFVTSPDPNDKNKLVGYYISWGVNGDAKAYPTAAENTEANKDAASKFMYGQICNNSSKDPKATSYLSRDALDGLLKQKCTTFNNDWTIYNDTTSDGSVIKKLSNTTIAKLTEECKKDKNCLGFTYVPKDSNGWLKGSITPKASKGITLYVKN